MFNKLKVTKWTVNMLLLFNLSYFIQEYFAIQNICRLRAEYLIYIL